MEKPVDILFVFDSAAIGYQDTKLILNIIHFDLKMQQTYTLELFPTRALQMATFTFNPPTITC